MGHFSKSQWDSMRFDWHFSFHSGDYKWMLKIKANLEGAHEKLVEGTNH